MLKPLARLFGVRDTLCIKHTSKRRRGCQCCEVGCQVVYFRHNKLAESNYRYGRQGQFYVATLTCGVDFPQNMKYLILIETSYPVGSLS